MISAEMMAVTAGLLGAALGYAARSKLGSSSIDYQRGAADAMKDWTAVVEPYKEHNEGWFKDRVLVGYTMQLTYKGLPVGEPTVKIVDVHEKIDREKVDAVLDKAVSAAGEVVQLLVTRKMNAKLLKGK